VVVKSFAQIQLPTDPGAVLQAGTKQYIDAADATKQPLDSDLTTLAGLTATTDSFIQSKASAWAARTVAQVKTDLAVPTIASDIGAARKDTYVVNVCDLGAVGDYNPNTVSGTNNTTAFAAAITAATNASIYTPVVEIYVPPGQYLTEKIPPIPNRVTLRGAGPGATRIYRKNSGTTTGPFVTNTTHARAISVRGMTLDGNGVGDATSGGVTLDNSAALSTDAANGIAEYYDARHFVSDLIIQFCKGHGLKQTGSGVSMIQRVQVFYCDNHGFITGADSYFSDCDAGSSGFDGFFVAGPNSRLTSCKAWYSGRVSTSGAGVTGGTGHGFHVQDGNYSTNTLINCEAQDNARAGFFLSNTGRHILSGCVADSNNTANLSHAGFELLGSWTIRLDGFAWDRAANTNHQLAGLRLTSGGYNVISVTADDSTMAQGRITSDTDIAGSTNTVEAVQSTGTPVNDDVVQRKAGVWTHRTMAQVKTDLAITEADVSGLVVDLAAKAPLASPTFTGLVTAVRVVKTPQTVSYASTVTLDASTGDAFAITATADMHLASPTNPTNGQMLVVEVLASGANRIVTIDGPTLLTTGLTQNLTIQSGQVGIFGFRFSSLRGSVWLLTSATQG